MTQKQLVLSVLEKLKPYRDMADVFLFMLKDNSLPEKILQNLSKSLSKAIQYAKSEKEKALFMSAIETIEYIQQCEKKDVDEKEADDLLNSL